jgi:hypothetical protein
LNLAAVGWEVLEITSETTFWQLVSSLTKHAFNLLSKIFVSIALSSCDPSTRLDC